MSECMTTDEWALHTLKNLKMTRDNGEIMYSCDVFRAVENAAYDRAANAISAKMSRYNDEGTERGLSWAAEVVSNLKHEPQS